MSALKLAAKATEHAHQVYIFDYVAIAKTHGFEIADRWKETGRAVARPTSLFSALPMLEWFHAIPNGGARGDNARSRSIRGNHLKAEGVKKGIFDMFLPFSANGYHGLFLELKKPDRKPKTSKGAGGLSKEQIAFQKHALSSGYQAKVVYGADEAIEALKEYLSGY